MRSHVNHVMHSPRIGTSVDRHVRHIERLRKHLVVHRNAEQVAEARLVHIGRRQQSLVRVNAGARVVSAAGEHRLLPNSKRSQRHHQNQPPRRNLKTPGKKIAISSGNITNSGRVHHVATNTAHSRLQQLLKLLSIYLLESARREPCSDPGGKAILRILLDLYRSNSMHGNPTNVAHATYCTT